MVESRAELNLKLTDEGSLVLNNMICQLHKRESEVVSLALKDLAKKIFLIDEYKIRSEHYNIKPFEDLISFKSEEYGFLVTATYCDFEGGVIYFNIYTPYDYLKKVVGLASMDEYVRLMDEEDAKTEKGFDVDGVNDYLLDIRDSVENELISILEEKNLLKEI